MTRADEVSDDMLMALADGELNETDAQRLHRRVNADPDLAARYADFLETRALMQEAFPPEPVPAHLIAAVMQVEGGRGTVVPFRKRVVAGWGMALAASIVLAVGGFWTGRSTAPMLVGLTDIGTATAQLATGEETVLADGSTARVLGSFATDLGLCRMVAQDSLRHVTCRDATAGGWALALSVQAGAESSFLPASDIGTGLIDRLLDDIGAGPALSPEDERRALSN